MSNGKHIVIVGAGQCGAQTAFSLREGGHAGPITLIGDESAAPYQRPPLSKNYLAGKIPADRIGMKPASFYAEKGIALRTGAAVERIDRPGRQAVLAGGEAIGYDTLVFATGSRVRRLAIPGAGLRGIHYVRTIADADGIRAGMAPGRHMTVIGGGYIGLEVASVAIETGMKVTVIEAADRVLARVTSPQISGFFEDLHRAKGVDLRTATSFEGFVDRDGAVAAVRAGGQEIATDLVVVGIGIVPNIEVAQAAGLACDNGIVVDATGRTDDPDVYAAGDCTSHVNPVYGRRLRLESVQNATDQAKIVASNLCGQRREYAETPWFWSNQYDVRLQIAGLFNGHDEVVERGDRSKRAFAVFYLKDGVLIAVDSVNLAKEYMAVRKLIPQHVRIPASRLADPADALA
jgi:3-phenylpropionate/trans-cinnamate dioxygenase ferredoxin reductase subunit